MRWFIVFVLVLFSGCLISNPNQLPVNKPVESITMTDFYYEMPEEQQKILFDGIKMIEVGTSYEVVKEYLGNPFNEAVIKGKKYDDPVRGLLITYYIKKLQDGGVNVVQDKSISIVFDTQNKVVEAYTNIEGLSDRLVYSYLDERVKTWQIIGERFALYKSEQQQ